MEPSLRHGKNHVHLEFGSSLPGPAFYSTDNSGEPRMPKYIFGNHAKGTKGNLMHLRDLNNVLTRPAGCKRLPLRLLSCLL